MADIISTLFGIGNPVDTYDQDNALRLGKLFAQATVNPNAPAYKQQGYMNNAQGQFALGSELVRGVGGLFGLETKEQSRQSELKSIMQSTAEEAGTQDPTVLYPLMAEKLADKGYVEEALRIGQQGYDLKAKRNTDLSDLMYKGALTNTAAWQQKVHEATVQSKTLEHRGQMAAGALTTLKNSEDPEIREKVWANTLQGLSKLGIDTASLEGLPDKEREVFLESVMDASETNAIRSKEQIAQMNDERKIRELETKTALEQQKIDLKLAIANMTEQIAIMRMDSAERIAAQRQVDSLTAKFEFLDLQSKIKDQADLVSAIGGKDYNKEIDAYLKDDLGLTNPNQIKAARNRYNTFYRDLLQERQENGYPKYNGSTAANIAKRKIESLIKEEPTWFGYGNPKSTYSDKSVPDEDVITIPVKKP